MLDFLTYILKILWNALVSYPTLLGGNWLSVLLPIAGFVVRESSVFRTGGWPALKSHIKKDSYWLLAFYAVLFIWAISRAAYQDDRHASDQVALLTEQLKLDQNRWQASYNDLQIQCAIKEGMNRTLGDQNRDQQNTINNCQNQALKLLTPESLKIIPVKSYDAIGQPGNGHAQFIVLTNKTIQPVRLIVTCNRTLTGADVGVLGQRVGFAPRPLINNKTLEAEQDSPPWTPVSPFQVTISYKQIGDEEPNIHCEFTVN
jgi:hypothetical protein